MSHRLNDAQLSAHAERIGGHRLVRLGSQLRLMEQFIHAPAQAGAAKAKLPGKEPQVLPSGECIPVGRRIEGDTATAAQVRRPGKSRSTQHGQTSALGPVKAGHETGQRRLARPIGPEHTKALTGSDRHRHTIHTAAGAMTPNDILYDDWIHSWLLELKTRCSRHAHNSVRLSGDNIIDDNAVTDPAGPVHEFAFYNMTMKWWGKRLAIA